MTERPTSSRHRLATSLATLLIGSNLALLTLVGVRQLDVQRRARNAALLLELSQGSKDSTSRTPREATIPGPSDGQTEVRKVRTSPSTCRALSKQIQQLGLDADTVRELLIENGCLDKERKE